MSEAPIIISIDHGSSTVDELCVETVRAVVDVLAHVGQSFEPVTDDLHYMETCDRSDPRATEFFTEMADAALSCLVNVGYGGYVGGEQGFTWIAPICGECDFCDDDCPTCGGTGLLIGASL